MGAKRCKIAVGPSSIDHRGRVLARSNGCFRILKRHLIKPKTKKAPIPKFGNEKWKLEKWRKRIKREGTYKAVALGSAGVLVCNNDGF